MRQQLKFLINDGGRAEAGFRGTTGDCVCRAVAIATGRPYKVVYDEINKLAKMEPKSARRPNGSSARTGVYKYTYKRYLEDHLGWIWTPTMQVGQGCRVHLLRNELPDGRLIVSVSRHLTAVIDGVVHDTHDPRRGGRRCVYGYWKAP